MPLPFRTAALLLAGGIVGLTGCVGNTSRSVPEMGYYERKAVAQINNAPVSTKSGSSRSDIVSQYTLTLQESVSAALHNNPELSAQESDVNSAKARLDGARSGMWPKLSAVSGYTYTGDKTRLAAATYNGEPGRFTNGIVSGDIVLNLSIFAGGRTYNSIRASELLALSTEDKLSFSREEMEYTVTSLYYAILAQKHVLDSLDQSYETLLQQAEQIKAFIAAQRAARVDLLRAEVRLADVNQRRIAEKNTYTTARLALINFMNISLEEQTLVLADRLAIPQGGHATPEIALSEVLKKRKDYLSAEQALAAQGRLVRVAEGGHLPSISLKAAYGRKESVGGSDARTSNANARDIDDHNNSGSVAVVFELPLFEGGATDAKVREERARYAAARQRLFKLEKQIGLDFQTALLNKESAFARIEATKAAVDQAKESLRIERMKYDLGKGTIIDTLDAESALLQAQVTYYRAIADCNIAIAKLHFVSGGLL